MALFLLFLASNLALFQVCFRFVLGSFFKARPLFSASWWLRSYKKQSFCCPPLPSARGRICFAPRGGGHGLRRIVPDLTTSVGYHGSGDLSSEDCYGANLGGNAGFQPAVVPPRCGARNRTVRGGARPKLAQQHSRLTKTEMHLYFRSSGFGELVSRPKNK